MLSCPVITIKTETGECEIFVSPFLLQSKEPPDIKSGKIGILYFYGQLRDNAYRVMVEKDGLPERFKSNKYIINYGQDFGKYYLGSLSGDFETRKYLQWESDSNKFNEQDVKALKEALSDPRIYSRTITLFTPTRPSDFNFGLIYTA